MSREIDERIVAMYFDNKNFERNAEKTIKTLEELKQSANMEGVGKGFEAFEQAKNKLNLDKLNDTAKKLRTSFSNVGDAMKKGLVGALNPLNTLKRGFDELNSYVTKVAGINIASKIVGGVESALRSLTIAPISAGWGQYENTMDSIKTIMSSTGESIETVKHHLGDMTEYANKTIYSLNDMTSNLGKFTNNGVKLEDATNAMIGLANATADAGQGAAQASMAMYNVSQAIGVGKMTTIDWKSLENANIATQKLKQTFIDAAVASGSLQKKVKKDAKTGKETVEYWTKATKGAKAAQVTVEGFRDSLNKGWLTKEAMMNTFSIFSGQLSADEIAALGFSKEESARLYEIGQEAMKAATEVRTFSKMMDALRESVQSSWATSFEYIFGDMQEGTNLWTELNDKIDKILTKSSENRNNILMSWRGMMRDEKGDVRRIEDIYREKRAELQYDKEHLYIDEAEYERRLADIEKKYGDRASWVDYREKAVESFMDLFDVLADLGGAVKAAWKDVFGEFNSDTLKSITQGFRDFVDRIKDWLGSIDDSESRISKIRKGLSGVFNILKIGLNAARTAFGVVVRFVKPLIDPLLNLFAKFGEFMNLDGAKNLGEMLSKLGDRFKNLWDRLTKLGWKGAFEKVGNWISDLWGNIKTGVSDWMTENGLGGVVEWLKQTGAKIGEWWEGFKEWFNATGIPGFISGVWDSVKAIFTTTYNEDGTVAEEAPIVKFFNNVKSAIETAYNSVVQWLKDNGIAKFFTDSWDWVMSVLGISGSNKKNPGRNGAMTGLERHLLDPVANSKEFLAYTENTPAKGAKQAPIVEFFEGILSWITTTWDNIKKWFTEESGIGPFFENVWSWITGLFTVPEGDDSSKKAPIVQFFENIKSAITTAYESVVAWFKESGISKFFTDSWAWVQSLFRSGGTEGSQQNRNGAMTGLERHLLDPVFNSKTFLAYEAGTPEDEAEANKAPIVKFLEGILSWIKETWAKIKTWFTEESGIGPFFENIWNWITGLFKVETDVKGNVVKKAPIVEFFEGIYSEIQTGWQKVVGWEGWAAIGKFFSDTWGWIVGLFKGSDNSTSGAKASDKVAEISEAVVEVLEKGPDASDASASEQKIGFFERILESLGGFWDKITGWFASIGAEDIATRFLSSVTKLIETIALVLEHYINLLNRFWSGHLTVGDVIELNGTLGAIIGFEWLKTKNRSNLAKIAENATSIGSEFLKVCAGLALISVAIKLLGGMNWEDLGKGAAAITVIGVIVAGIIAALTNLKKNTPKSADEPIKGFERIVGKLISTIGMVVMMNALLDKLPEIIRVFGEAKKAGNLSGDDLVKLLLGLVAAVSGLSLAVTIIEKLNPKGLNPEATFKTVISMLEIAAGVIVAIVGSGGILSLVKGAINGISGDSTTFESMINEAIEFVRRIGELIGALINGIVRGITGQKSDTQKIDEAALTAEALEKFANQFDEARLSKILRIADFIGTISKYTSDINTSEFANFATAMGSVAQGLVNFSEAMSVDGEFVGLGLPTDDSYKRYEAAIEAAKKLFEAFSLMADFAPKAQIDDGLFSTVTLKEQFNDAISAITDFGNNEGRVDRFASAVKKIMEKLGGIGDASNVNIDGIAIVRKLYEAVQTSFDDPSADLPEFNAKPIVDAIIDSITAHQPALAYAIRTLVQTALDNFTTGGNLEGVNPDKTVENVMNFVSGSLPKIAATAEGTTASVGLVTSVITGFLSGNAAGMANSAQAASDYASTMKKVHSDLTKDAKSFNVEYEGIVGKNEYELPGIKVDEEQLDKTRKEAQEYVKGIMSNWGGLFGGEQITPDDLFAGEENGEGTSTPEWFDSFMLQLSELEDRPIELMITPVITLDDFGGEVQKLRSRVSGEIPLEMQTSILVGENQRLPIDDTQIVDGINALRDELYQTRRGVENAIDSINSSLGNRISSLGDSISRMKFVLDTGVLAGAVDSGLYDRERLGAITGVYPSFSRP